MKSVLKSWMKTKLKEDKNIVVLLGDMGGSVFGELIKEHNDRVINVGICEQAMVSMASGFALAGMKPYVYTLTPFIVERAFEQIKIDIDSHNVNVKMIGYCTDCDEGLTHKDIDSKIMISLLQNVKYYNPITKEEMSFCLDESYNSSSPAFIKMGKNV